MTPDETTSEEKSSRSYWGFVLWPLTQLALVLLALAVATAGCSQKPQSKTQHAEYWPRFLRDDEVARLSGVGLEPAGSPQMWDRFKPRRITDDPVRLATNGIQYYLDQETFDKVEVAIPSGGQFGFHGCFIGVTVERGT